MFYKEILLTDKCYIYPSGGCANAVVNILKDCFCELDFVMLDDKATETSLQSFVGEIKESGKYLLVCAGDVQEELLRKCQEYGISNAIDGRVYTAFVLAEKISQEARLENPKFEFLENGRILHVLENRWIGHLYFFWDLFAHYLPDEVFLPLKRAALEYCESMGLQEYLRVQKGLLIGYSRADSITESAVNEMDNTIVYCGNVAFYESVKERLKNCRILLCHWVLLDYFVNTTVLFVSGSLLFLFASHKRVTRIGVGHSLCDAFHLSPQRIKLEFLTLYAKRYFEGIDYYLVIDYYSKRAFETMFKQCGIQTKCIEAGSLSLEKKGVSVSNKVESFMFIPRLNSAECVWVIRELLKRQKKVIFRLHPATLHHSKQYKITNPYAYLDEFLDDENFSLDYTESVSQETLAKSVVITDNSSLSYSAPLSTLRPCVLFAPPKKEFDLNVKNFGISFYNETLHRVAINAQECVKVALQLEQNLTAGGGALLSEEILKYREKIYNVGCTKKVVLEILKSKVEESAKGSFCD